MPRDILHLHIPDFAVAVARVIDPALRQRPVALASGTSERALLQCVSTEGRAEGLVPGMAVRVARRLCPRLTLIPPDPVALFRAQAALCRLGAEISPLVEPEIAGRLYLDISGSRRLLGPGRDVAARLEGEVDRQLRLSGAVGLAGNKLVSRIAAGYLERPGVCDVLRGSEAPFISTLPVSVLPGVGQTRASLLLRELHLRRVGDLAALSLEELRLLFGGFAPLLRQRACGIDPSPVSPPARTPEVREQGFLPQADNDDEALLATLARLVEGCAYRLRQRGQRAGLLVLTLYYEDGVTARRSRRLPSPVAADTALMDSAEALFYATCQRRVRLKGMRLACRELGTARQLDLFASAGGEPSRREGTLLQALDQLRQRHGVDVVRRGRTLLSHHREG
ncbi:DNA polymerase IV [Desulfuromonas sp. KJ2020]|uniref:DNA polymerase Y family protein n=1 Tax=Desulfuromonas sp. KJ2020 TaxID=2919173 RepID=UPI0020A816A2|nr:DNA polymerase IV [Desulfuromonas sp. KJ2020]MCP3176075.1 DNA polymerase IV [Desulfuromonas sp. KJ2020]